MAGRLYAGISTCLRQQDRIWAPFELLRLCIFLLRLIKVRHEDKRRGVAGIVGEPDLNARHPGSGTERKRRKIELIHVAVCAARIDGRDGRRQRCRVVFALVDESKSPAVQISSAVGPIEGNVEVVAYSRASRQPTWHKSDVAYRRRGRVAPSSTASISAAVNHRQQENKGQ